MLLLLLLLPKLVHAATTARIVLVAANNVELTRKVRAEAEQAGILVSSDPGASAPTDAELLRRHRAVGVVEIEAADRARIYISAFEQHEAYSTVVECSRNDCDGFAALIVEQVRGHLVELRLLPTEVTAPASSSEPTDGSSTKKLGAAPTSPPIDANAPSDLDRFSPSLALAVGGGLAIASGGMSPTPSIALGLRVEPARRASVTLRALLPVVENEIKEREGEASVRVNLFVAEFGYRLAPDALTVQPELGAGAGILVLPMESEATPPLEAHADELVAGVYFVTLGISFEVASWLRLRGAARAGLSAPRPVVRFSDREVAAWGPVFAVGTLEVEFRLPLTGSGGLP